jgi:hypothetical protein
MAPNQGVKRRTDREARLLRDKLRHHVLHAVVTVVLWILADLAARVPARETSLVYTCRGNGDEKYGFCYEEQLSTFGWLCGAATYVLIGLFFLNLWLWFVTSHAKFPRP